MPVASPALLDLAISVLAEAHAGGRASAALGQAISYRRLLPAEAEQISALVYGAFRRERRIIEALREIGADPSGANRARFGVIGAGLMDGATVVDLDAARRAWSEISWPRFLQADRAVLERTIGPPKVALLGSLPDFVAALLTNQFGDQAEPLAASLSAPAPRALRVNALKADVTEAQERLEREGATITAGRLGRRTLVLQGAFNPFVTRAFHEGVFEMQDEGSQLGCELVAPPPRGLVVDVCAGAGGKSLAVAAALEGRGKVVALDVDESKLVELRRRAKRASAANIQALGVDEHGPLPEAVQALVGKADRVLIDAPCSGTGTLRRNPEVRARLTPAAVERLVLTQRAIIERSLPLLAPGGRLVFVTCSLLRAEGEALMDTVEAQHPELTPVNLAEIYDRAYIERFPRSAPHRVRLLPHLHDTDGFFITVLRRKKVSG